MKRQRALVVSKEPLLGKFPPYLICGRDRRQRQAQQSSLDVALQSGAPVISRSGRRGHTSSGRKHLERRCRPGGGRACSAAAGERRHEPAQGSHGCLRWAVVNGGTRRLLERADTPSSRETPWVFQVTLGLTSDISQSRENGSYLDESAELFYIYSWLIPLMLMF